MENDLPDKLQKLESNLAHLEHQYDQLNQVVMEQGRMLARLMSSHQKVSQAVETMEIDRIKANNAKPPHYQ